MKLMNLKGCFDKVHCYEPMYHVYHCDTVGEYEEKRKSGFFNGSPKEEYEAKKRQEINDPREEYDGPDRRTFGEKCRDAIYSIFE